MSEVCDNCPFIAACDVARELASNPNHTRADTVIGGIDATEFALRGVISRMGECSGPVTSQNGQQLCPGDATALFARGMGAQSWPITPIPLESYKGILSEGPAVSNEDRPNGQYL